MRSFERRRVARIDVGFDLWEAVDVEGAVEDQCQRFGGVTVAPVIWVQDEADFREAPKTGLPDQLPSSSMMKSSPSDG